MASQHRSNPLPDFVIVGAPKCGTTALWTYLKSHAAIYFPAVKEPNYFSGWDMRGAGGFEEYVGLFATAKHDQICGEASTMYMFYPNAVPRILEHNPFVKIIALVRNPLDMVLSYHCHMLYAFCEIETSLTAAWRRCSSSFKVGPKCADPNVLDYRAVCRLGEQVQRLKAIVPENQLHLIVYDDLRDNPKQVYQSTLCFLRVGYDGRQEFPVVGSRRRHRSEALGRILMAPPPPFANLKDALRWRFPHLSRAVAMKVLALNQRPADKPQLSEELRLEMVAEFGGDIELLGQLLGRDLRYWHLA